MATSVPATRLRLDKSRPFGTIHGERTPGDPHQFAHYSQDGIYFDAAGLHLEDLIADDKTRALVDRRLKRQGKPGKGEAAEAAESSDDDAPSGAGSGSGSGAGGDVNLEAWLRGEQKYQWFVITATVRQRYSNNINKMADMIEFLVHDEKVVAEADLAPEFADLLKPKS